MVHQGIEGTGVSPRWTKRRWGPRAGAAMLVLGLTACSSLPDLPDYANPVEWYRSSTDMVGDWFKDDGPAIESASATTTKSKTAKKAGEKFPNLGTVPEKPAAKSTAAARAQVKNQLSADRANARYTDEKATSTAKTTAAKTVTAKPAPRTQQAPKSTAAPKAAAAQQLARLPSSVYSGKRSSLWPNAPAPGSSSQGATTSARVGRPVVSSSGAISNPLPSRAPVVMPKAPKPTPRTTATATAVAPSVAPVAPPAPEIPPKFTFAPQSVAQSGAAPAAIEMATPVLQLTPPSGYTIAAGSNGQQPMLALGGSDRGGATGVVNFGHGSARLSASDRSRLRGLAKEALNVGAYIRVVGHASMRTRDMDPFEHTLANFNVSLKRANVVASALMEMGVPAEQLIVDAVGDTQPLFSEAMPSGERANRRTEIYLES